ncbi:NmrA family transcriptional regulator [Rufibacter sp. DG15C]|uniref:SDR family oxidoreductase n=1 Tax=Rufibacter sp. DG15C TaxID=1379909 RepID=UPI00078E0805|nr:SDR family oxidoreductase [Rufibacter sp. DG15C]AMM51757.1 NmrA family transcriptional regulator [Rufibacter sp. DG15C]
MKRIAITGATGHLGRLVIQKLKEKGTTDTLIGLVRSPEKAADLGIETRLADYEKPDTLNSALQGIDTLLLISGSEVGKRAAQHQNVIASAKNAGVKWIVYTSLLHADTSTLSLAGEHRSTEEALKESGIPHTILRNGWYTENYTGSIGGALAGGAFIGSAGEGKISSAARADFAEAAAVVLTTKGHEGKVYELAGDEAYTLQDLAAEISRQTGKTIPYKNLSKEEYAQALADFGLPEGLAQSIAGWDISASQGDLFDDSHQLSKLIGRPTTPLSVTVAEALRNS